MSKEANLFEAHDAFVAKYGEELAERIFLVFYGDVEDERVYISRAHKHDAINSVFCAHVQLDDIEVSVYAEDGNMVGSRIIEWTDQGNFNFPKLLTNRYELALDESNIPEKSLSFMRYQHSRKHPIREEMETKINYDFHFCPTDKIRNYWEKEAAKYGWVIVCNQIEREW